MVQQFVTFYMLVMCIIGFFQMMVDKKKAKKHMWRISENTLILTAVLGGSIGSYLGMQIFRHKTKHPKFYITVPVCVVIHIALYIYLFYIYS